MQGSKEILTDLDKAAKAEIHAILDYTLRAEYAERWGYCKLAQYLSGLAKGEMGHLGKLTERLLDLGGWPDWKALEPVEVPKDIPAQLAAGLKLEQAAVTMYRDLVVAALTKAGDVGTSDMLEAFVRDEEGHVVWTEAQLEMIREIGLENYLAAQV